jgi:tetratricopeptide (TPR) repeat protein
MHVAALLFLGFLAQSSDSTASAEAKAKAQSLLTEGSALYEKGDYADALDKFKQAFATYDSPKLLFNIGQANRDLGRPVEALEAFERFLIGALDAAPETIEDAKRSVEELQKKLGRLRVDCQTDNATISVDGKEVGLTPLPKLLWATTGRHQVTARHWSFPPAVEDVEVRAGSVQTVRMVMQVPSAQAPLANPARPEASPERTDLVTKEPKPAEPSGWWMGRKWTWVAAGSAVLFTAGAAAAGLSMQSKYDSLNRSCGSGSQNPLGCSDSDINAVTTRRNAANVMWALAGASAVTAGILFFVEGHPVTLTPVAGETVGFIGGLSY